MRRLEKLRPADVPEYAAALSRRTGKPPLVALVEEWAKDEAYNALAWERLRKRLNEGRPPDRQITDE